MKTKKNNKIPTFKTVAEEAKFWDTRSFADYWGEFKDVDLVVNLAKQKEETLVLRVSKDIKDTLQTLAKKKGISISTLVRLFLIEKLHTSS